MKKHLYIVFEAFLNVLVLMLVVYECLIECNIVMTALAIISSLFFIDEIVLGFKLILDIVEGPKERNTIFMGSLGTEHLDFFYKISFSNVFFDDELLTKNYLLFENVYCGELHQNDEIAVKYYKLSRIVLQVNTIPNDEAVL